MSRLFLLLTFAMMAVSVLGFAAQTNSRTATRGQLSMKTKTLSEKSKSSNLARKLKRKLRSADAANFEQLFTSEFDAFLKNKATDGIYKNIMDKIKKTARQLKTTVKPDFGVKPPLVRPDIVETAVAAGTFATLVQAVAAAGLVDVLKGGQYTVLAPSDEAFAKLPAGTVEGLLTDIPKLQAVLKHHVVKGWSNAKTVEGLKTLNTLQGTTLAVKLNKNDNVLSLDSAKVVTADIKCQNGVIHVIDSVLIPSL